MQVFENIKFDVNHFLIGLFIPGVFAVTPFLLVIFEIFPETRQYLMESEGLLVLVIFTTSVAAGLILEDFGSNIEIVFDYFNKVNYPDHKDDWEKYLGLNIPINTNSVAQRYLRTLLVRMKFELSFFGSFVVARLGLHQLNVLTAFTDNIPNFWFYNLIYFGLLFFILHEAHSSSKLLIKTRKIIINSSEP